MSGIFVIFNNSRKVFNNPAKSVESEKILVSKGSAQLSPYPSTYLCRCGVGT